MSERTNGTLRRMMERFVQGDDRSVEYANEIEAYLYREFRGTQVHDELIEDLATYRPEGGKYLVDQEQLVRKFEYVLRRYLSEPGRPDSSVGRDS